MVKSCCAIGCYNKCSKGGVSFYRFPTDKERRNNWVLAVKRKDWEPNEYTWLCSAHFIGGVKSNDPLSPDYMPSIFSFSTSTQKLRFQQQLDDYERRRNMKKTRLDFMPIEDRSNVEDTEQGITVSVTEHVSLEVEPGETSCIISENVGTKIWQVMIMSNHQLCGAHR